jgi:hypothetical protein
VADNLWAQPLTSKVTTIDMPYSDFIYIVDNIGVLFPLLGYAGDSCFVRIVCSTNLLAEPPIVTDISVMNSSAHMLTNLSLSVRLSPTSTSDVTNWPSLAPGMSTLPIPVTAPRMRLEALPHHDFFTSDDACPACTLTWTQTQTNRTVAALLLPFGAPEKNVLITVSNSSVTVGWNWLGLDGQVTYD